MVMQPKVKAIFKVSPEIAKVTARDAEYFSSLDE
jgi:hypothetical protein